MKSLKMLIAIGVLIAVIVCAVSSFAMGSGASGPIPEMKINYCSLSFSDSVYIMYAVSSNVSNVQVLVWNGPQTSYTVGTQDATLSSTGKQNIGGVSHQIFEFSEPTAQQMADVFYARAYVCVDGVDYYSEVNKYSILQYVYNMIGKTSSGSNDQNLRTLLSDMLTYGASAQRYFGYKTDRLATADFYQVKLTAGLLDDGCNHGLYLPGDKVTLIAPETDANGATFAYWSDSKGGKVATEATFELTVGSKNEVYSPVYVKYSSGLEFDSNGDGTCYVIGMGDCEDTDLVIPSKSPAEDMVIGIDNSAFAGEAITSVTLPNTIEEIGRRAFNNCTELTDVYYDGTEEEWNEISISSGNDAIEDATKHFNEPTIESFTVTFKDYDGSVLKTETVESGKSATAPSAPTREGYTFTGWDKSFDQITEDLTVTAQYKVVSSSTEPTVTVDSAIASVGEEVTVAVSVQNNPGILGMTLKLQYDESVLKLKSIAKGEALNEMTFTTPKNLSSGCKFPWDAEEVMPEDATNGVIVTLTFTVLEETPAGVYDITFSYDNGAVIDNDMNPVDLVIENGTITVK